MAFRFKFGRQVRRHARRQMRRGEMSVGDYKRIAEDSRKPEKVAIWRAEVERKAVGAPWLVKGASPDDPTIWERIREWIAANWPMILKIILGLLMFVEEPKFKDVEEKDADEPDKPDYKLT